jgi:23S rRNA (uracil1939-C5)-methyltransferase
MMQKKFPEIDLTVQTLSHNGYAVAHHEDRTYYVRGAIPEEKVKAKVIKKRRGRAWAEAIEIIEQSPHRIDAQDIPTLHAGVSWQIMDFEYENNQKKIIVQELFKSEGLDISIPEIIYLENQWEYRNKVEYSFWIDDEGLSYAFHRQGTKGGKIPLTKSKILPKQVNQVSVEVLQWLKTQHLTKKELKMIQFRYSFYEQSVYMILFLQDSQQLTVPQHIEGLVGGKIVYSDPRSPAAVETEVLTIFGKQSIIEEVGGLKYEYPLHGFFQVYPEMFTKALIDIRAEVAKLPINLPVYDLYSGVGTIGIALAKDGRKVIGIELFPESLQYAQKNATQAGVAIDFIEGAVEDHLPELPQESIVILDPPRSGLHPKIATLLLEYQPQYIVYLSCNPLTQARDLALLQESYTFTNPKLFNFYPRTPHVESLSILKKVQ